MATIYFFQRSEWVGGELITCGGCGYRVADTFLLGGTETEVREKGGHSLCGDCLVDFMMVRNAEIELQSLPTAEVDSQ